jgi:hypothetical protein
MSIRRLSELGIVAFLVVAGPAYAAPSLAPAGAQQEEPLDQYRERFKAGMDHYKAGELAEAIGYWEPIYRELGDQKGYRLAYNLGVAYAELGDATRAAERLQSFVTQVDMRRGRSESLAVIVQKEEADARARIAGLTATKGRIQVDAGVPLRAVQVDASEPRLAGFVAWVSPGEHTITFAPGTADALAKRVTVRAGETVEVMPVAPASPPPPMAPSSPQATTGGSLAHATLAPGKPWIAAPALVRRETEHPFSPVLVAVSGTLALGAAIAAVPLENRAWELNKNYSSDLQRTMTISADNRQSFSDARAWAYGAVGAAIGLGVLTAGLATWYFFGASQREVVITPTGVGGRF